MERHDLINRLVGNPPLPSKGCSKVSSLLSRDNDFQRLVARADSGSPNGSASAMDAMIARVIAPASLVLPPVRTPTAQVSRGVTEATRCLCAARYGQMPDLQAGWRNMESCIHWQQLVCRISVLPSLRIMTGQKLQEMRSTSESYFYAIRVHCKE